MFDLGLRTLQWATPGRVAYLDLQCGCEATARVARWDEDRWHVTLWERCATCQAARRAAAAQEPCTHPVVTSHRLGRAAWERVCQHCGWRQVDDSSD